MKASGPKGVGFGQRPFYLANEASPRPWEFILAKLYPCFTVGLPRIFAERHYVVKMALRTNSTRPLNHRSASSASLKT